MTRTFWFEFRPCSEGLTFKHRGLLRVPGMRLSYFFVHTWPPWSRLGSLVKMCFFFKKTRLFHQPWYPKIMRSSGSQVSLGWIFVKTTDVGDRSGETFFFFRSQRCLFVQNTPPWRCSVWWKKEPVMFKALFCFLQKGNQFLTGFQGSRHYSTSYFMECQPRVLNFAFTCIMVEAFSDLQVFIGHGMQGAIDILKIPFWNARHLTWVKVKSSTQKCLIQVCFSFQHFWELKLSGPKLPSPEIRTTNRLHIMMNGQWGWASATLKPDYFWCFFF